MSASLEFRVGTKHLILRVDNQEMNDVVMNSVRAYEADHPVVEVVASSVEQMPRHWRFIFESVKDSKAFYNKLSTLSLDD